MTSLEFLRREPDIRAFSEGETIFKAGQTGDCMYAIVEGAVNIKIDGAVVERLTAGGVFGEMALIDSSPRSATAVAASDCTLAAVDEKRFLRLVELTPNFALQMLRLITHRLRRSSHHH
jgi:CRP/FNR family transcriptional regulator, cyclic AMP receptor protein